MEYLLFGVVGVAGGILGGMGMGGGTILIPILSIFFKISQHAIQAINLISFIPMSVVALIIHLKNKLIEFNKILLIIIPGILTCIFGCYFARAMSGEVLKKCFGGFLILLSIFQFLFEFVRKKNN